MIITLVLLAGSAGFLGAVAVMHHYYYRKTNHDQNAEHFGRGWDAGAMWILELAEVDYQLIRKTLKIKG